MKTGMIKLAVAVVGMAAAAKAGPPEGFRPQGGGHYGGFGPVIRDHRTSRCAGPPDATGHRAGPPHASAPAGRARPPDATGIVRDHRTPPPVVRDHRTPWRG